VCECVVTLRLGGAVTLEGRAVGELQSRVPVRVSSPTPLCLCRELRLCSLFNSGCFVPELDHEAITADASVFTAVPSPPAPTPA
jgi:hypothetical protein